MHPMTTINLDEDLINRVRGGEKWAYRTWEPDWIAVVLGRSNQAALEVHEARCLEDGVPVIRRRGGGGTVVLSPGMVVISVVIQVDHQLHFQEHFWRINTFIIEALQTLGIAGLSQQGHSDICLGSHKILGSSMYGSRNLLFYTASLMIANDLSLIDRYLRHPSKEPDYRQGRSHQEFLITIGRDYPHLTVTKVKAGLDAHLPARLVDHSSP